MADLDNELLVRLEEADKALKLWLQEPGNDELKQRYKQKRQALIDPLFNMSEALKQITRSR